MKKYIQTNKKEESGFILTLTLLIVSAMLLIILATTNSTVSLLQSSRNELNSLKAFYAADSGIECVSFLESRYQAFDTTSTSTTYSCGVGNSFVAGGPPGIQPIDKGNSKPGISGTGDCVKKTYSIPITGFDNGSQTTLVITITPRTINVGGQTRKVCDLSVLSHGESSGTGGPNVAERTRWKQM
jgi:hypothetical protein